MAAVTDLTPARAENVGAVEDQIVMRMVFPTGKEGDNILLPPNVLDNLPGYLKRLPDGRYRVYFIQGDTRRERMIIDVNVRQGRPVDAGDDSEGTQDRPPSASRPNEPHGTEEAPAVLVELLPCSNRRIWPQACRRFVAAPPRARTSRQTTAATRRYPTRHSVRLDSNVRAAMHPIDP